jgi:hypothetical protein
MVGHCRLLVTGMLLATTAMAHSETLEEYAKKCDRAIGVTVPQFNCDPPHGKLIPTTHSANGRCDRPNVLNEQCDPNSTFQVLSDPDDPGSNNVSIVALCRKKGNGPGKYGDIAVIQHNRKNGATCFYQARVHDDLDGVNVQPPSNGEGGFWMSPADIVAPSFGAPCGSCHDNGPIIRSPYLNQLSAKPHKLPGADDDTFNSDGEPYYFVGSELGVWKAYKVEVARWHQETGQWVPNKCNECHRMGVNNVRPDTGTSRDFAKRSTDQTQVAKNPHSAVSPIWMPPHATDTDTMNGHCCTDKACIKFCPKHFDAAMEIKHCADRFSEGAPLPSSVDCKITQFSGPAPAPTLGLGGQLTTDPAVGANADGRLEVFARGADNALWHIAQKTSGGWSSWESLSGQLAGNSAVGRNADDRLEVFARWADNALWHIWQTTPNGEWSGWHSLGGQLTSDPVGDFNADGRLEVFARWDDKALWHRWQVAPNGGWSERWASLGGELTGNLAVGRNADGGLEVYVQGTDNALWRNLQNGSQWSGWDRLGGQLTNNLVLGRNVEGWLQVFVRGGDNELWHSWLVPGWN